MRGVVRSAALAATLAIPMLLPPAPVPAPISRAAPALAAATTTEAVPVPQEIIEYPGRLQGVAPPRWAWLMWLVYR
ncbi:MAG TPA: hypothetical protein VGC94_00905 [Amnibacterium sp.]|jgi:hypothetical protein